MRGGKKKVAKRLFDHEESRFDDLQLLAPCRAAVRGASVVCFFFLSPPLLRRAPVAFGLSSKEDAIFVVWWKNKTNRSLRRKSVVVGGGERRNKHGRVVVLKKKRKKSFCVYFFRGRPLWERERVSLSRRCVRDLTSERLSFVFVIPRWCSTCLKRWPARTKPPAPTGNEKRKKQFFSSSTIYGSVNFSFTEFLLAQQFIWLATMGGMFLLLILK